jgi:hypothetical protein
MYLCRWQNAAPEILPAHKQQQQPVSSKQQKAVLSCHSNKLQLPTAAPLQAAVTAADMAFSSAGAPQVQIQLPTGAATAAATVHLQQHTLLAAAPQQVLAQQQVLLLLLLLLRLRLMLLALLHLSWWSSRPSCTTTCRNLLCW